MAKFLVAFSSRTGHTEKVAGYLAEGIRMSGNEVDIKNITDISDPQEIADYAGYALGCPTYHRDMTGGMKQFLFKLENLNLTGKFGAAFGSYTHSGDAPGFVFDTMQHVFKMDMTDLGSLNVIESTIETSDGIKAAQDYGRAFGSKAG